MKAVRLSVFLLGCLLFLFSCRKEKASWNSNYKLILINDTLRINQISKDSLFAQDGNGNLMLSFEKDLLMFNIFDQIRIPDTTIHQKYSIAVSEFNAPPGFSLINQTDEYKLELGDARLTQVKVQTGTISLRVENIFPTKIRLDINLPNVKKNGVPLAKTINLEAGTATNPDVKVVEVDLSGYTLNLAGLANDDSNILSVNINLKTDPNGTSVIVTNHDYTNFDVGFHSIKLDMARGYFGQQTLNESFSQEVEMFQKLSGVVAIDDYNFDLILKNSCKVEGKLLLKNLKNVNLTTNQSVDLNHELINQPIFIQSATGTSEHLMPYQRIFNFNSTNSNVSEFIGNLGSKFSGEIGFSLNPNGDVNPGWNEIFSQSNVSVAMRANMPLNIGLSELMFVDTFAFNFNNQTDVTHLKNGIFTLEVTNAYPIDLSTSLRFLDENNMLIGEISSPDIVQASTAGTQTSNGVVYAKSTLNLVISEALASKLSRVKSIVVRLKADTQTNPPSGIPAMTKIPHNGFIGIQLFGDFGVNFKI